VLPKLKAFPVAAPTRDIGYGKVISGKVQVQPDTYTQGRLIGGTWIQHNGIDIAAPDGMLVLSSTKGVVNAAHYEPIGGYGVQVLSTGHRSKRHWIVYYGHLAMEPFVEVGQEVNPGSLIGLVGHTGGSGNFAPHLHFHTKYEAGGSYIYTNPYDSLRGMANEKSTVVPEGGYWYITTDWGTREDATGLALVILGARRKVK
jgi:murein DD-endopeptidase MepM/ murein hydrolase activator NlpD